MIVWIYAQNFGELPSGEAEHVEALVQVAEQLDKLNTTLAIILEAIINKYLA